MGTENRHKHSIVRIEIGERIRREREAIGMDRNTLAEKLGVSEKTIKNIETGVTGTTIYRMIDISYILNVPLDFLLKGEKSDLMSPEERVLADKAASIVRRMPGEEREVFLEMIVAIYGGINKMRDLR